MKHMAGDLVKLETTPKHSSASNPAERAIQAIEEQARTIREDCQMRCGNGETFGADKPIWAWLLRHAGWQISRYEQKGNGMTAYKQAYGSSRVFGLVEERRRTNTSSSHLKVECFLVQFDDWNRHDDTMLYFSVT